MIEIVARVRVKVDTSRTDYEEIVDDAIRNKDYEVDEIVSVYEEENGLWNVVI